MSFNSGESGLFSSSISLIFCHSSSSITSAPLLPILVLQSSLASTLPGLGHEVVDVMLEVVYPGAHVVDPGDDLVRHGLEPVLHLLEHVLDVVGQLGHILGVLLNPPPQHPPSHRPPRPTSSAALRLSLKE